MDEPILLDCSTIRDLVKHIIGSSPPWDTAPPIDWTSPLIYDVVNTVHASIRPLRHPHQEKQSYDEFVRLAPFTATGVPVEDHVLTEIPKATFIHLVAQIFTFSLTDVGDPDVYWSWTDAIPDFVWYRPSQLLMAVNCAKKKNPKCGRTGFLYDVNFYFDC